MYMTDIRDRGERIMKGRMLTASHPPSQIEPQTDNSCMRASEEP